MIMQQSVCASFKGNASEFRKYQKNALLLQGLLQFPLFVNCCVSPSTPQEKSYKYSKGRLMHQGLLSSSSVFMLSRTHCNEICIYFSL